MKFSAKIPKKELKLSKSLWDAERGRTRNPLYKPMGLRINEEK